MGLDKNDIKALIAILQKGLTDDTDDDNDENDFVVNVSPKKTPTRKPKTAAPKKKKSTNNFDKMPEFNMCKEDLEVDQKIRKPPPSIRAREFDFVKVKCRVCGKSEKVAPSLVESIERYKCNKCSTGAG